MKLMIVPYGKLEPDLFFVLQVRKGGMHLDLKQNVNI